MENNLTFELTKDEAQAVLDSLVKEPYEEVFQLINKIQQQAKEQLETNES